MDNDEIVGVSPQALRWLRGFVVSAAVRIHDLGELTQSEVINKPPLNTPRVQELNQELAATSLYRMRIVANALAGMAKYLDERATYQELVSGGGAGGVEPPRYPGFMPEDPNHLLNLGIGGLQVGGGIAGAAAILAVLPEPLVSKIAAGGLALYSLFVADAGVRTIMSGGETVAEPYPDQAVEWAALRAGLSQQDAAGIKHSFAFSMGTVTMVAPLAGAGMIRHSVITTNASDRIPDLAGRRTLPDEAVFTATRNDNPLTWADPPAWLTRDRPAWQTIWDPALRSENGGLLTNLLPDPLVSMESASVAERALGVRRILDAQVLGGDHINGSWYVTYYDGSAGIVKLISAESASPRVAIGIQAPREVAMYRLDEIFGSGRVPTTTWLEGSKLPAGMQHLGPGAVQEWVPSGVGEANLSLYPRKQVEQMAVLDYISANTDRHMGNYLSSNNGVVAVDHGLTFPETDYATAIRSSFVKSAFQQPLSADVAAAVRAVDAQRLAAALRSTGLPETAIDGALARLREIQQHGMITGEAWRGQLSTADQVVYRGAQR